MSIADEHVAAQAEPFHDEDPEWWKHAVEPDFITVYEPTSNGPAPTRDMPTWLERASELLAEPDPGPLPWLVDELIVEQSICAVVGRWKTTKSYGLLDIAISIVTGRPFLGIYTVPKPRPVVFIIEESGRAALWRRLDSLCRGRAIDRDELNNLHVAANKRVRLDDTGWQTELINVGIELQPAAFIFDPLARMKAPSRDENAQKEYAPVIEYLRDLRDKTGATAGFVQHTGHAGETMRGTSDLESVWESRLSFKRDGRTITIESEHREADDGQSTSYRLAWDEATRTMRLNPIDNEPDDDLLTKVRTYLEQNPDASKNDVNKNVEGTRAKILRAVDMLRDSGTRTTSEPPEPPSAGKADGGSTGALSLEGPGRTTSDPVRPTHEPEALTTEADDDIPF